MNRLVLFVGLLAVSLTLVACGSGVKKQLGLEREPIDEFTVITNAPLTLPPEYDLRPPDPGSPALSNLTPARDQARQALLGPDGEPLESDVRGQLSGGEETLLRQSGGFEAPQDIRDVLESERRQAIQEENEDEGWFDFNFDSYNPFISSGSEDDELIDPAAEKERLENERQSEAEEGQDTSTPDTGTADESSPDSFPGERIEDDDDDSSWW